MNQVRACPHCSKPIKIRSSLHDPNPDFGPNVATHAIHTLARLGLTLSDARNMTDEELLSFELLGKQTLRWIRTQGNA